MAEAVGVRARLVNQLREGERDFFDGAELDLGGPGLYDREDTR